MEPELARILDECIDKIKGSSSVEVCVAQHPEMHRDLEPLLYTSKIISGVSRIRPRKQFKNKCRDRLVAMIAEESLSRNSDDLKSNLLPFLDALFEGCRSLWRYTDNFRKVGVPVMLTLILTYVTILGVLNIIPPMSIPNGCKLTVLKGTVDVQSPEFEESQRCVDGMTLDIGDRVITGQDDEALLTFYDGSSLSIEPGTDIEIQELKFMGDESVTIVVAQSMGKTWSRVVKMADEGTHFEIKTPSAVTVVHGTYFSTEVGDDGETTVRTIEGMVSVSAQGNEVMVTPGLETIVEIGAPPTLPLLVMSSIGNPRDNANGLEKPGNDQGNAYGLDKPNNGQGNAYAYGLARPVADEDDVDTQDNTYNGQGNAYGLDKSNNGQGNAYAYGLDKTDNNQGNAYGPDKTDNNQGNAYGLNKDNNGNGKGQNKGSDTTNVIPDYQQSANNTESFGGEGEGAGNNETMGDPGLVIDPEPVTEDETEADPEAVTDNETVNVP